MAHKCFISFYYKIEARKTRETVIEIISSIINRGDIIYRADANWIYAMMANCYFATDQVNKGLEYEKLLMDMVTKNWQIITYQVNKSHLLALIKQDGAGV